MVIRMFYYMFGMDEEQPEKCARELRTRGFSAVINPPSERAVEALHAQGLDVYGCIGAFSMQDEDPPEWLSEDAFGKRRRWFGSGCPNEPMLAERGFQQIENWKKLGAKGVLGDGARFASPCPGTELFFNCFCSRCMALGRKMGFDMEAMRERVRKYATVPDAPLPNEWLRFREQCTARWFVEFSVRANNEGMLSGSFVFAPSLGALVGQTPVAAKPLQIVAPMLYRRYLPHPGIACLNAEYASLYRLYTQRGDRNPTKNIFAETGVQIPAADAETIQENGFAPQIIAQETARAKDNYSGIIAPILQLDDEQLGESVRSAVEGGAEAIGFFAYNRKAMQYMPELDNI